MPVLFKDLTDKLLEYKNAGPKIRQAILEAAIKSVEGLPETITTKKQATKAYKTMAYASQIIKYSDNLRKIENQEPFEILFDFAGMGDLFTPGNPKFVEGFAPLAECFEFGTKEKNTLGTLRLLKPHAAISPAMWTLFQEAQREHMKVKADKFKLIELDIFHPPANQLYPLPQFMGAFENKAVDRVCPNSKGEYAVAKNFKGELQSAGGGMVDIDLENSMDVYMRKALEEHLEEEHGELYITAAAQYDALLTSEFFTKLRGCINLESKDTKGNVVPKFAALPRFGELQTAFLDALNAEQKNSDVLARLMDIISAHPIEGTANEQGAQKKLIHELKAMVQVETFKLHPLFAEAFNFIKSNSKMVEIDQVNDLRRGGGEQTAYTFMMRKPIEVFFESKGIKGTQLADDMTGGKYVRQTFLTLLANFEKVRFSHVMTFLASQLDCLENKTLEFKAVWDNNQYAQAKTAICDGGAEKIIKESQSYQIRKVALLDILKNLREEQLFNRKEREAIMCLHNAIAYQGRVGLENTEQLTVAAQNALDLVRNPSVERAEAYAKEAQATLHQSKGSLAMLRISQLMLGLCAIAIALCVAGVVVAAPVCVAVAAVVAVGAYKGSNHFFAKSMRDNLPLAAEKLAEEVADVVIEPFVI